MKNKIKSIITSKSEGLTTAEYAVVTIAATTFAGVLIVVVKSGAVQSTLEALIQSALSVF